MSDINPSTPPSVDSATTAASSPASVPSGNAATSIGLEPNIAAGIAALFMFLGGLIFFFVEKKSTFVRFWAAQLVVAWGGMIVLSIAMTIVGIILAMIADILAMLFGLLWLVYLLAWAALFFGSVILTFTGKTFRIPVVADIADKLIAKFPATA